jgi:hypothetical protein
VSGRELEKFLKFPVSQRLESFLNIPVQCPGALQQPFALSILARLIRHMGSGDAQP